MRSNQPWRRRRFLAAAAVLPLALPARADTDFLAGETLTVLVASAAGSGNDLTARHFAEMLGRRLPRTRVAVQNLGGAGGLLGERAIREADPDGLTVAFLRSVFLYRPWLPLQPGQEVLDPATLAWVGGLSRESRVLVAGAKSGVGSLAELLARQAPFTLAADGTTSTRYFVALLVNALLGARLKPVTGYEGGAGTTALIGGEVDGLFNTFESSLPAIEGAGGRVLLRVGGGHLPAPHDAAPVLDDLAVAEGHRWVLPVIRAEADLGRFVVAPPGVPPERLARLRGLLEAVAADPAFLAGASALGLDVQVTPGDQLQQQLAGLPTPDAAKAAAFQALLACGLARSEGGGAC